MAEMDYRVGQIVDCVEEAGIADNTLIVFSSDNATCASRVPIRRLERSLARGILDPAVGGLDAGAAMVRWPGKVPAGVVTEEMLSAHDWYKTFAALAGAVGQGADRPTDGRRRRLEIFHNTRPRHRVVPFSVLPGLRLMLQALRWSCRGGRGEG